VVEAATFSIDDYLMQVVEVTDAGVVDYRRLPLSNPDTRTRALSPVTSYDLSVVDGHYYPTKPPGVTLLAATAYAPLYAFERAVGIDPDRWWPVTVNAYITTVLAAGLIAALGGIAFFSIGRSLFPKVGIERCVWATLAYGLGTLVFPYSTMLFDHAAVCGTSIAAFALLARPRLEGVTPRLRNIAIAGLLAGFAVVLNRGAIFIAASLFAYTAFALRSPRAIASLAIGGMVPAIALMSYQAICFGDPFSFSETFQLDLFESPSATLWMSFELPQLRLLPDLLLLPFRGLLFWSPVLVLAGYGVYRMGRDARLRPEFGVIVAVTLLYLLLNLSFSRWHGGAGVGPRYLTPMIPFLALGLIPAFDRLRRIAPVVAAVSVAMMLLATAVNPMVRPHYRNPLTEYYLPLARGAELEEDFYTVRGPVSVNPDGMNATGLEIYSPDSRFARWNAFNLGEMIFPGSWASLLPLALAEAAILGVYRARRKP
jgi:hypothetical protein